MKRTLASGEPADAELTAGEAVDAEPVEEPVALTEEDDVRGDDDDDEEDEEDDEQVSRLSLPPTARCGIARPTLSHALCWRRCSLLVRRNSTIANGASSSSAPAEVLLPRRRWRALPPPRRVLAQTR